MKNKEKETENVKKIKADMERFKYEAAQEHGLSGRCENEKRKDT
ncbi:MAG: small, acid-soluble spore protein, alpha/beta type [Clostridia bacterium]|jgi:hypothetical protein|nr:small, acid-soluble spore protein, alpha/beta type [Clostridia bacterium]